MRVAILTLSDSGWRGERQHDGSGEAIRERVAQLDAAVVEYALLPDEKDMIAAKLKEWADSGRVDVILTTGGTGLSPRDFTPEATMMVIDRIVPGMAEAMRAESIRKTPRGMLSRGVAGVRGKCLVVNLPGSPKAVRECLDVILPALPHAVEIMRGDARDCARSGRA
ncbi:MAG: MogA/MoaB family molybdenum cofactor biosynthesis protein [Chloroflexi bacterium]|nr:MogA/MoaB family molybdenum cofactor biosynthesis protein [Chloroflexota bacterium]